MSRTKTEYRVRFNGNYEVFGARSYKRAEKRFDQLMEEKACKYCVLEKAYVNEREGWEETEEIAGFELDGDGEVIWW